MTINKLIFTITALLLLTSCAQIEKSQERKHEIKQEMSETDRALYAQHYFSLGDYLLQTEDAAGLQLLQKAMQYDPNNLKIRQSIFDYLLIEAKRDTVGYLKLLEFSEYCYKSGVYNSEMMFYTAMLGDNWNMNDEAHKFFKRSLTEDAEKSYYLDYYRFLFGEDSKAQKDTIYLEKAIAKPWHNEDREVIKEVANVYEWLLGNSQRAYEIFTDYLNQWPEENVAVVLLDLKISLAISNEDTYLQDYILEKIREDIFGVRALNALMRYYIETEQYEKIGELEEEVRRYATKENLMLSFISAVLEYDTELMEQTGTLLLLLKDLTDEEINMICSNLFSFKYIDGELDKALEYFDLLTSEGVCYFQLLSLLEILEDDDEVIAFTESYYNYTENKERGLFLVFLINREAGYKERLEELLSMLPTKYLLENQLIGLLALPFSENRYEKGDKAIYENWLQKEKTALGIFYFYTGDKEKAKPLLEEAYKNRTDNVELYEVYSDLLEELNEIDEMIQVLRDAVHKFPDNTMLLNNYGYRVAELDYKDDFEEAEEALMQALAMEPDNEHYWDSIGWLFYRKGQLELAFSAMSKTGEFITQHGEVAYHFGMILYDMGEFEEAQKYLQIVLDISGDEELKAVAEKQLKKIEKDVEE